MIFLGFILIVTLGLILVQLGSYSVWMVLFSAALKLAGAVIAVLVALLVWSKVIRNKGSPTSAPPPTAMLGKKNAPSKPLNALE